MLGFNSKPQNQYPVKGIYVSIDALFDLRLGALMLVDSFLRAKSINSSVAIELSMKEQYYTRDNDEFAHPALGSLSRSQLYALIAARGNEILPLSPATPAVHLLAALVLCARAKCLADDPKSAMPKIIVDTHGFDLTAEQQLMLLKCLDAKLEVDVDIELKDIGPHALDAHTLGQDYMCVLMYNYPAWLEAQAKSLPSLKAKSVECYFPRIHFIAEPDQEQLEYIEKFGTDFYRVYTELILGPFVLAQLTPVALYSAHTALNTAQLYAPDLNHRNDTSGYGLLDWRQNFKLPDSAEPWLSFKNMSAKDLPKSNSFDVKPV